jgi:hypothetical protein
MEEKYLKTINQLKMENLKLKQEIYDLKIIEFEKESEKIIKELKNFVLFPNKEEKERWNEDSFVAETIGEKLDFVNSFFELVKQNENNLELISFVLESCKNHLDENPKNNLDGVPEFIDVFLKKNYKNNKKEEI